MATIKDIAKEAGVSYTTVSNVIHGKSQRVSAETIERINKIIEQLDYMPNMTARALVSQSSRVIGIINHLVPRAAGSFVSDPFHSAFIGAIEERLRENGYYLMIRTVEDSNDLVAFLRNWNIDGMFFTGLFEDEFFHTLSGMDIPVVLIDSYIEHTNMQNVGLEDRRGGYIATKHLIDNGHKNIAFASPSFRPRGVIEERYEGYKQALTESGIAFRQDYVFESELTVEEGMALGQRIADRREITAVFASADLLAAGILAGLHERGLSVPQDISLIGFDDINFCRLLTPPLTTIHQDADQKGNYAVDFMMKRLQGLPIENPNIVLPVHVVERQTVRNIS